jgi:hypothetical protein
MASQETSSSEYHQATQTLIKLTFNQDRPPYTLMRGGGVDGMSSIPILVLFFEKSVIITILAWQTYAILSLSVNGMIIAL